MHQQQQQEKERPEVSQLEKRLYVLNFNTKLKKNKNESPASDFYDARMKKVKILAQKVLSLKGSI